MSIILIGVGIILLFYCWWLVTSYATNKENKPPLSALFPDRMRDKMETEYRFANTIGFGLIAGTLGIISLVAGLLKLIGFSI
jgi:hypothetical protein